MNFIEYPDRDLMMIGLADRLSSELENTLLTQARATLCVPGGTTPGPAFDSLSASNLDWSRVNVVLSDERWVTEDQPRSNTRLLKERLLVGNAERAYLQRIRAETATPEEAMDAMIAEVRLILPITVLLLGMGNDYHIASIFHDADNFEKALAPDAPPLMAMRSPTAPEPRVTLTAPVLANAMHTHILITGPEKREALERARNLSPREAPVKLVLNDATVHWAE
ncbi:6-phosphogluconolactonase [Aliiruegeria sabulilitoris]|uniref:6-phosphogluconolactonase n=1 Tax=Aliiruegeria sabulilitoris TaxID=1510458 RepID=UPI0008312A06|nr:6-phosphogluconolactonase [Aliiruegeria sabulilitoris]NDR59462.1 6-phosphogluconolactonase [Pseudoruegeria sp. M32A2M]